MGEFYSLVLDGNNGLFPLVVGVVEMKARKVGGYLHAIIGDGPQEKPWTIMSDGQKGIDGALLEVIPEPRHSRCCRHLLNNFKKKFPGLKLRKLFWAACRAYIDREFNLAMAQIQETSPEAHDWMRELPLELWARHVFDCR
ncbi:uncharacterized protein LOC130793265 isoform X1 [Actinidia eriantha]|uniref:uncharacterized protein LOC130793265 isoform X1 n=1 Tax=Actinidia eriantha TaxID=165200 RepID=UPI0025853653|nr:uncharacterized protein LOC130793265 isoform X1 [Actinidia eriantha]